MTIKLGNLADWRILEGKSLAFVAPDYDADKPRKVRLFLNSEDGCNWYIRTTDKPRFLAFVPAGLETLEFVSDGDFEIGPANADIEVQYWTSEAEEYWTEGDGETFSTIYERQPRNEALEYVMFQAAQNQLRRDKAHAEELASIRAEIGAMNNGGQSRVHGGAAAEYQESGTGESAGEAGTQKVPGRAADGATVAGDQSTEGANGTAKGSKP